MDTRRILNFLTALVQNNNREWFAEHKDEYLHCKEDFERFTDEWIMRMQEIDPTLRGLSHKDCIWRIYRDTRFSPDKTPYKNHFGAFLAQKGGKKSEYGGYYVHLQPDHCLFAAGMWCPEPELLKAVRTSLLDNYDEMEELMDSPLFKKYFTDFDTDYMLKKVPQGFPADAPHADWLKRKTFTLSRELTTDEVCSADFMDLVIDMCKAVKPINDFLNYDLSE